METINKQVASAFIVNMFAVHKGSSLIMAEIETGIVRLRKIRDDIPYDLINDKVNAKAKEIYEESLRIKPNYRAYYGLATLHFYQQHYSNAAEMYEKALSISDKDYRVWSALAESYFRAQGKQDLSAEKYRRAISLAEGQLEVNPQDPGILSDLAGYYASLGNQSKARSLLNRAITFEPSDLGDMFRVAEVYQQ